jgi:hypothetical protein
MVVFIGYSLPAYDAFAREFFQRVTKGKIVEVYTDSAQVLDDYRNILSPQNILTIEPITFENCPYAVSPFEP